VFIGGLFYLSSKVTGFLTPVSPKKYRDYIYLLDVLSH